MPYLLKIRCNSYSGFHRVVFSLTGPRQGKYGGPNLNSQRSCHTSTSKCANGFDQINWILIGELVDSLINCSTKRLRYCSSDDLILAFFVQRKASGVNHRRVKEIMLSDRKKPCSCYRVKQKLISHDHKNIYRTGWLWGGYLQHVLCHVLHYQYPASRCTISSHPIRRATGDRRKTMRLKDIWVG